ncbi:MAG: DUF881 domain-containing protein [Clostridia bacterium]
MKINKIGKENWVEKIKEYIIKSNITPYILIGISLFFLALMLTAQVKSVNNTSELLEGKREAQLIDDLAQMQRKYIDLKKKNDESLKVVEEYETNSSVNNELVSSMKEKIKELSIISGLEDVKGEGLTITLSDGSNPINPELRQDTLVHDTDVSTVVNELKAAGAEAISVNGQRIISSSSIRCVGPVIQVNYQKVAAPFVIKAIGKAEYLESAINIKNGVSDLLKEIGISVVIKREKEVKIAKYDQSLNFKIAILDK